jgi:hypothetical protein
LSDFFNGDGVRRAYFHTGVATQAFFSVHGNGFAALQFVHFNGTDINAFPVAAAFVGVHDNIPAHGILQDRLFWDNGVATAFMYGR